MALPKHPYFVLSLTYQERFDGQKSAEIHCLSPKPPAPTGQSLGYEILKYQFDPMNALSLIRQRVFPAFALLEYKHASIGRRNMPTRFMMDAHVFSNTQNSWQQLIVEKITHPEQNEDFDNLVLALGTNNWTSKKGEKGAQLNCVHPFSLEHSDEFSGLLTQNYYMDYDTSAQLIADKNIPVLAYIAASQRTFQNNAVDYLDTFNPVNAGQKEFEGFTKKTFVLPKPQNESKSDQKAA